MSRAISDQIEDIVADLLGTREVDKQKYVSDLVIDNAKQTSIEKVETAIGYWFIRAFVYAKKAFAQVQTPDKEVFYFLPKALAKELSEMQNKQAAILIPNKKPRDRITQQVLANKKNAAGPHRDKKREVRDGKLKHKNQIMESGSKLTFKQFIQETSKSDDTGLFSYKLEYKDSAGRTFGGDWEDVDMSKYELMSAHDIAMRVSDHQGPSASGDVGFITELVKSRLAFNGYPKSFVPQDYDLLSERNGVVKIQIIYDLYDPDGRSNFHQLGKTAVLTFMER